MSVNLHHALGKHHTADGDVAPLARPARTVDPDSACDVVDEAFRTDPDLACLAVLPRSQDPRGRWGLLSRGPFMSAMAGRLGYGRSVHARRPVRELADWAALVLDPRTSIADAAQQILTRDRTARYSEVLVTPAGTLGGVEAETSKELGADAVPQVQFLEVEDVLRALAAQLTHKALTDPLTQLANREHFLQQLTSACSLASEQRRQLVVVHVDVDDFKAINDGHGHATGDRVLQQVGDRLRAAMRPDDLIARLGGDEFAVLVQPPLDAGRSVLEWADALAQRLLRHLSQPVRVAGRTLPGQASIGVAVSARGTVDPAVLLNKADMAMYGAKSAGGSRCAVVDGTNAASVTTAHAPDRVELQKAVDAGEFVVHFQPIVDVLTGRLRSTEALVRWKHPSRGLLPPVAFLGDVAAAGFAASVDAHVLDLALAQHATWAAEHPGEAPEFVNVNLSVQGLLQPGLATRVLDRVARAGLPPRVLRLELPEVATSAHLAAAAAELAVLRGAGVGVTLDDVGSGAAGFGHLRDLRLDGIKIDRRFVAGMLTDERDAAVVRMLAEMGHELGVAVTAEGAETSAHVTALQAIAATHPGRVLHVQGYAISRPVPSDELSSQWLAVV